MQIAIDFLKLLFLVKTRFSKLKVGQNLLNHVLAKISICKF